MENFDTEKSQALIFDNKNIILYSSDALFDAQHLLGKNIFEEFQILKCIEEDLRKLKVNDAPVFLPHVAFACKKYKSICDFIFLKLSRIDHQETVWLINDNSLHYQPVIVNASAKKTKHYHHIYTLKNNVYRETFKT
jgi:hypothetical protein